MVLASPTHHLHKPKDSAVPLVTTASLPDALIQKEKTKLLLLSTPISQCSGQSASAHPGTWSSQLLCFGGLCGACSPRLTTISMRAILLRFQKMPGQNWVRNEGGRTPVRAEATRLALRHKVKLIGAKWQKRLDDAMCTLSNVHF
jgi:hypothetical protein